MQQHALQFEPGFELQLPTASDRVPSPSMPRGEGVTVTVAGNVTVRLTVTVTVNVTVSVISKNVEEKHKKYPRKT